MLSLRMCLQPLLPATRPIKLRMLLKQGMGNGKWEMGNGKWGMGNGKFKCEIENRK